MNSDDDTVSSPPPRIRPLLVGRYVHRSVIDFSMPLFCAMPHFCDRCGCVHREKATPITINDDCMVGNFKTIPYGFFIYSVVVSMMKATGAFVMGGWVRDCLIGRKPNDIDMYVRVNDPNKKEEVADYFKDVVEYFFNYIYGHSHTIDLEFDTPGHMGYASCLRVNITVDGAQIISIDLNRYDTSDPKDALDASTNIDFIQNGLAFKYVRGDHGENCIVLRSEVNHTISPTLMSYVNQRTMATLASLALMIGVTFDSFSIIACLLTEFLGSDWLYIQTMIYTMCKRTPEMYACHHRCHVSDISKRRTEAMRSRCSKFSSRGFKFVNMKQCCEDCHYKTPAPRVEIIPNRPTPVSVPPPPVVVAETVKESLQKANNNDTPPTIKWVPPECVTRYNWHKMRKDNRKKMKHQAKDHVHLTDKQMNVIDTMTNLTVLQRDMMLGFNSYYVFSNKTSKTKRAHNPNMWTNKNLCPTRWLKGDTKKKSKAMNWEIVNMCDDEKAMNWEIVNLCDDE
mgnify:CR=1 FL=1